MYIHQQSTTCSASRQAREVVGVDRTTRMADYADDQSYRSESTPATSADKVALQIAQARLAAPP